MRTIVLAAITCLAFSAGAAFAVTPAQITAGFVDGTGVCLEAALRGTGVGALPDNIRKRVAKAPEDARFMAGSRNPSGPLWTVNTASGNVLISEAADGDCEVISFGPPVDATLKKAVAAIIAREPGFADAGDAPDSYTPIRYGLRHGNIHIVLDGAEPGTAPGRTFRFSMLNARFVREATQP